MALKFEGMFKAGDTIKAHHFPPSDDRPESYLIGKVLGVAANMPYKAYEIEVSENIIAGEPVPITPETKIRFVPMEVALFEFDERVSLVN